MSSKTAADILRSRALAKVGKHRRPRPDVFYPKYYSETLRERAKARKAKPHAFGSKNWMVPK